MNEFAISKTARTGVLREKLSLVPNMTAVVVTAHSLVSCSRARYSNLVISFPCVASSLYHTSSIAEVRAPPKIFFIFSIKLND